MKTNRLRFCADLCRYLRSKAAWIAIATVISAAAIPDAKAISTIEANTMMNAYNTAFFVDQGTSGYYKDSTATTSATYFWGQAEEIEMLMDAYERTGNATWYAMITKLCNGFTNSNGTSWTWDTYNDDMMWACIAFARAYQQTGNTNFRTYAKNNFDACYARAWDTAGGGGMWWTTAKTSKNSCVNFPAAIASYLLYQALGDSSYLTKSQAIFDWGKAHLWNSSTGQVYDSTGTTTPTTYNQGTFIGAANFLGDAASATLVANYTMNSMGTVNSDGYRMWVTYDPTSDGGGFNGILARWVSKFMGDRNLQSTYLPWLQANAINYFNRRRASDNLSWCNPWSNTPESTTMDSWGCSSSVVAIQVIPVTYVSSLTYALINRNSGRALVPASSGTTNNTALIQWSYNDNDNYKWNVTNLGGGQCKIIGVASGRAVSIDGASTANNAVAELYDYSGTDNQKVTFFGNHGDYYTPIFVHSGKALTVFGASTSNGASIIQYTFNSGRNAQWQLREP